MQAQHFIACLTNTEPRKKIISVKHIKVPLMSLAYVHTWKNMLLTSLLPLSMQVLRCHGLAYDLVFSGHTHLLNFIMLL